MITPLKMSTMVVWGLTTWSAQGAEQWDVYEAAFSGPALDNPYLDVQFAARFTQGARTVVVPGFWDGGDTYRIRFSPPTSGEWRYETTSRRTELNGRTGSFTASRPSATNHGPVQVFKTFYLRYADGTPYHQFGTTCYAWVHQTQELQEQTLQTLAASPFNKIRFCVPQGVRLQSERAGVVRISETGQRRLQLRPPRSGVLAAF